MPQTSSVFVCGHLWFRLFFVCLCFLPACGRRTLPKAPELVRPSTIEDLAVAQTEAGVELSWGRPDKYADGTRMSDLGTFTIERALADAEFQPVETVAVTDRDRFRKIRRLRYTDRTAAPGQRYRYRVLSSTLDDYVSAPSNVVEIEVR
jgi:hypothetical protein